VPEPRGSSRADYLQRDSVVTVADPRSFACPKCGAKPGVSCLSYRGKVQTLTRFHPARVAAVRGFYIDPDGHARLTLVAGMLIRLTPNASVSSM